MCCSPQGCSYEIMKLITKYFPFFFLFNLNFSYNCSLTVKNALINILPAEETSAVLRLASRGPHDPERFGRAE